MSVSSSTCPEWVVLLEVADDDGDRIDRASFARLIESWTEARPTTLYSPSRYALQVHVDAASPSSALSAALLRWKEALRRSGLPEWGLVRAEVVTPQELEREIVAGEVAGAVEPGRRERDRPSAAIEDDLLRRALHDQLTGLQSREIFLDGVRRALAPEVGAAPVHGMIAVHVGQSRPHGASLSQMAMDDVLVEVADRMARTVRWTDVVARIGDHELAVLVEGRSRREIDVVAARIRDRVSVPVLCCGLPVEITASLGTAMAWPGDDADVVLLCAEDAMRAAIPRGVRRSLPLNPVTG